MQPQRAAVARATLFDRRQWRGLAVLAECTVLSVAVWLPIAALPRIPVVSLQQELRCQGLTAGTPLMTGCLMLIDLSVIAVPLALTIALFVARRRFGLVMRALAQAVIPDTARFLILPGVVTLVFGMSWTYLHHETATFWGFVPHMLFPAVVGAFSFAVTESQHSLRRLLDGFMRIRDWLPYWLRVALTVAIPSVVGYALVADGDLLGGLKQQLIALGAMVLALMFLLPREGR